MPSEREIAVGDLVYVRSFSNRAHPREELAHMQGSVVAIDRALDDGHMPSFVKRLADDEPVSIVWVLLSFFGGIRVFGFMVEQLAHFKISCSHEHRQSHRNIYGFGGWGNAKPHRLSITSDI
jgi:hypothetical protein